jgi:hypothetical protein
MWCSIIGVIVTLSLGILAALRVADAQPVGKMYRIGLLNISSATVNARPLNKAPSGRTRVLARRTP